MSNKTQDTWLAENNKKSAEFWASVDAERGNKIARGVARADELRRNGASDDFISEQLRKEGW